MNGRTRGWGKMSRDVNKFGRITFCSLVVILIAALSVAATGIASASTNKPSAASDQYVVVADKTAPGPSVKTTSSPGVASTGGTLPFTGVSLIWTAIGAVALVGLGMGLRRHDRKS